MSEVQSRPYGSRGRGSFRGGRGGYRGARNGTKTHGRNEEQDTFQPSEPEDQGEVGELKKKFGPKVASLREVCEGWSDEDLVYALKETEGDVNMAFDRISSGSISQWGEVKKKHPKAKDSTNSSTDASAGGRGGRGRGNFENRGRGRGAERSRAARGARGSSQANGTKSIEKGNSSTGDGWAETPAAAESAGGWDTSSNVESGPEHVVPAVGDGANEPTSVHPAAPTQEKSSETTAPAAKPSTWSKLFAPPPPAPKKATVPVPVAQPEEVHATPAPEELPAMDGLQPPIEPQIIEDSPSQLPEAPHPDTPIELPPSKDELTETNLERLPDVSHPPVTATAASTAASTQDPLSTLNPIVPAVRPGMSGYAASALKATTGAGRTASFTRRVMEQQEAVVMPGNHAVDRAAVQFGSMGLNGSSDDVDVDEDREEPETRPQLPDDSPAAPRASLPPSHHEVESTVTGQAISEPPIQRQAPGLPPVQHQTTSSSPPTTAYADQYRYGQAGAKGYDPFGQQQNQPPQAPPAQAQSLEPFANQVPSQSQQVQAGQTDYPSYGESYQNYYNYGHPQATQQRSGSATFATTSQDTQTQYATSRPQQTYGQQDAQHSGHNTPNPTIPGHQAHPSQHMPQHPTGYGGYPHGYPSSYGQQQQQQQYAQQYSAGYGANTRYGANRPLFDDVRRQGGQETDYYQNQYNYAQNQQQYTGGYNKSSVYGQPQQQYSYEHSSSPANTGGYGHSAIAARETTYGRTGSAQPSESQQAANTAGFGGISDPFGRSHSGFGQQGSGEDATKTYEGPKASGPSPAIGQANRPGSAVNSIPGQQGAQAGSLPPPQSQHLGQTFSGYPQYAGYSAGPQGQSNHPQNSGYAYGSNTAGFGSTYGQQYGSGRGWNAGNYTGSH